MVLQQGYDTLKDKIRTSAEVWHLIVGIVGTTAAVVLWMLGTFTTTASDKATHEQIIEQMTAVHKKQAQEMMEIRELLTLKIQQDKLDAVNRDIKANDTEQFNIQQWMKVNGEDSNSVKRLKELETEKDRLQIKRGCIISGNRLCN